MAPITNRCAHCGAPLSGDEGRRCSYCNVVQPANAPVPDAALVAAVQRAMREDRDGNGVPDVLDAVRPKPATPSPAPAPAPPIAPVVAGAAAAVVLGVVVVVWALRDPSRPVKIESARPPVVTASAPPPPSTATIAAVPASAVPADTLRTSASARPAPKLTNEQFGKNVVAAQNKKLRGCVEQDLLRNPDAPKAYTVTVLMEKDGLPRSSATTFSPAPTEGFAQCARHVILYGFSGYGRNPPELVEFTFSTSFAFPDAKPAAKAESGRGWD